MGLVEFDCPLRGEKRLLLEQKNLDSVLKSIFTWSSASVLNLKMWRLKTRAPQAEIDEFFKACFLKWENGRRMNWPPPKKYNPLPLIGQPPPEIKKNLTSPKTQNSKIPTPLP